MIEKAVKNLENLGLKENEARIYTTCLKFPMGLLVHEIHNLTKIKRSSIDVIIKRLLDKGYITKHQQGKRWAYCAEHPETISYTAQEQINKFNKIIPALEEIMGTNTMPKITLYQDLNGLKKMYHDILLSAKKDIKNKHEILTISSGPELVHALPNHYNEFIRKRVAAGTPMRILAPDDEVSKKVFKTSKAHFRSSRFFNVQEYQFDMEINIYSSKIALLSYNQPFIMGAIIDNAIFSSSFNTIFQIMWDRYN